MPILNLLSEKDVERFRSKVDCSGGPTACWPWTDAPSGNGYGYLGVGGRGGRKIQAHQIAFELAYGPIPKGKDVDHTCRNRRCSNHNHLEAVTRQVNLQRGPTVAARNAAVTHCRRGHPYDAVNTRIAKNGARVCRTCQNKREFRTRKEGA